MQILRKILSTCTPQSYANLAGLSTLKRRIFEKTKHRDNVEELAIYSIWRLEVRQGESDGLMSTVDNTNKDTVFTSVSQTL